MYTLLQSETVNLVKICVHIGEWYRYRDKNASHRMEKRYSLEPLRKDLNTMQLLPSVTLIYANHPKTVSLTNYDVFNLTVLCLSFFAVSFFLLKSDSDLYIFCSEFKIDTFTCFFFKVVMLHFENLSSSGNDVIKLPFQY